MNIHSKTLGFALIMCCGTTLAQNNDELTAMESTEAPSCSSENCVCFDPSEVKIDTEDYIKSLTSWKAEQDKFFMRGYAVAQLFSPEFKPEKDTGLLKQIYEEQSKFFDQAYKLLSIPEENRDSAWHLQYHSNISVIDQILRRQTLEPIANSLEAKAMISQQINHLESLLKSKDLNPFDFCKQCWIIYHETKLPGIRTFVERHEYSMNDQETEEFNRFKEENPVEEIPDADTDPALSEEVLAGN